MTKSTDIRRCPLGVRVPDLTPAQLARLRTLERYDLSFVAERLVGENDPRSGSVASAILEFKRYMSLAALGYRGLPVPSQEVDDVWHAFLLFTREYGAFCHKTVGFFVHHIPTASGGKLKDDARVAQAYRRVFGLSLPRAAGCRSCTTCRTSSAASA